MNQEQEDRCARLQDHFCEIVKSPDFAMSDDTPQFALLLFLRLVGGRAGAEERLRAAFTLIDSLPAALLEEPEHWRQFESLQLLALQLQLVLQKARQAEEILRKKHWAYDPAKREARAVHTRGLKGNARQRLMAELIVDLYRHMKPLYEKETDDHRANPLALREGIAYALEPFFTPAEISPEKSRPIWQAIDNCLK